MLSRTPRGFLHSPFPFFRTLFSISLDALRPFHDSGYIPAEWNGAEDVDRIAISLFILYMVENLPPILSLFFFSFSFPHHHLCSFFVHKRCTHYPTILPERFLRGVFYPSNGLDMLPEESFDEYRRFEHAVYELRSFYKITSADSSIFHQKLHKYVLYRLVYLT